MGHPDYQSIVQWRGDPLVSEDQLAFTLGQQRDYGPFQVGAWQGLLLVFVSTAGTALIDLEMIRSKGEQTFNPSYSEGFAAAGGVQVRQIPLYGDSITFSVLAAGAPGTFTYDLLPNNLAPPPTPLAVGDGVRVTPVSTGLAVFGMPYSVPVTPIFAGTLESGVPLTLQQDQVGLSAQILGVAPVVDDGSNYNRLKEPTADGATTQGKLGIVPQLMSGATLDRERTPATFKTRPDAAVAAGTPQALWTPGGGSRFRLMTGELSLSVAGQIILFDNVTEILRSPQLAAGATFDLRGLGNGIRSSAINNVLNVDVSAGGNVGGWVGGTEE